jgi:hypothetical protein
MKKYKLIILILVTLFFSCYNEEDTVRLKGIVDNVTSTHLGKDNYNHTVYYNYTYNKDGFKNKETFTSDWQGNYKEGDIIIIQFNRLNSKESKIIGKSHLSKKVNPIKLKSK